MQLYAEFQPIIALGSGAVYGYEALGRGPAAPSELLDQAARDGTLLELDHEWRRVAVEAIAQKRDVEGRFFLNIDTRVLDDPHFAPGSTLALLERHGLPASRFVLELSERGEAMTSPRIEALSQHYRRQGFRVALDDLGAGYSALTTVVRARPDVIKLDMELVQNAVADPLRLELVRALAQFSRRTGIELIAEGIERWDEVAALISAGVRLGQGYLLARPSRQPTAPHSDLIERLRRLSSERPLMAHA
jgi:EAL domain-containing protein (putative c-di-GMP-specific phosphodiesterase class I)